MRNTPTTLIGKTCQAAKLFAHYLRQWLLGQSRSLHIGDGDASNASHEYSMRVGGIGSQLVGFEWVILGFWVQVWGRILGKEDDRLTFQKPMRK